MSLSLSSLLNPSPDSETQTTSPPPQKDSLPPILTDRSPPEQQTGSPNSARSTSHQVTYPSSTRDEAAQALASLSASPVPPPQQWGGYTAQEPGKHERQHSWERRQSGYGDPLQLPQPPSGGVARKMSSPTLDQYHVASRSPEQRRPTVASPSQSTMTLPPIQALESSSSEQTRRFSHTQNGDVAHATILSDGSQVEHSHNNSFHQGAPHVETAQLPLKTRDLKASALIDDDDASSSVLIKQETTTIPLSSASAEQDRLPDLDHQAPKPVSSLATEHSLHGQSPLRDSSVPVPTTEVAAQEQPPIKSKKRPAPAKTKKGTASAVKKEKAPPAKKRKVEPKRSATPSSQASKPPTVKGTSAKGTPMNSSPVPSTRSYSLEPNEEPYDEDDEDMEDDDDPDADLYCICRKPDNGTFMIGCDGTCDDWFHGKCVGIEERDKNLIDKYICPNCTDQGIGRTTFKRMCRRRGCRQAARVGKTKSGSNGSKYCSDECGVAYYRELATRTRGREESAKSKSSRRKSSFTSSEKPSTSDDLGARGGALSAGEVKALLNASKTTEEFRKLGDGVLSPPVTPDGHEKGKQGMGFTEAETQALQRIVVEKEEARRRHALLKDRMKFVTLVKQAASRAAQEKELKPKEYCGYDSRLQWTELQFLTWRNSKIGKQAFEVDTLQTEKSNSDDMDTADDVDSPDICDRKKCARHHDWSKLAVDDIRFEMGDNSDRMRGLDSEEKEIKERVALRAKAGNMNGATVEYHGLSTAAEPTSEKQDAEPSPKVNGSTEGS